MIFNQEMNEDENINEETMEGQEETDMNAQEDLEVEETADTNSEDISPNEENNEEKESEDSLEENPPAEEVINEESSEEDPIDADIDSEESPEQKKEENVAPVQDYLSPEILEVREVKEEDLIDTNQEEKFELNQDLVVNISKNNIVKGSVASVSDRDVFIDIGFKTEGIVPLSEFKNPPIVGKELEVVVERFEDKKGNLLLSKEKADFVKRWNSIREAHEKEEVIKGVIIRRIKGGMVVDLDVIQAFLPGSQIDIKPITDFDEYLGKEFEFKIVKLNELRKNVVLSRKELLAVDLFEKRKEVLEQMEEGMVLEGLVKNITDFGAFIDLGGIDGLLHITDITWGRINHPSDKLEIGQKVEVKVIDFDLEKVRVSLGMKQLHDEPWDGIENRYPVDMEVEGKVVNMMNYGLFIELEEGVEGLIHISEISWTKHIKHPSDVYNIGDIIKAKILSLEVEDRKISLGVKQLSSNPWDEIESSFPIGSTHKGIVKNLTQFGAFIQLNDSIDGLLHISDMSWTKIVKHPKDIVNVDDEIEVKVLEVSGSDKKLSLGLKQMEEDPWPELSNQYSSGMAVKGKVIKILDKGVIFELDSNIEGILKINNKTSFKIDEEYDLTVQGVDLENKKIIIMDDSSSVDENTTESSEEEPAEEPAEASEELAEESAEGSEEVTEEPIDESEKSGDSEEDKNDDEASDSDSAE